MSLSDALTATGFVNAAESITCPCAGAGGVAIQIVGGTFSGTITFEGSVDAITFSALLMAPIGGTAGVTTATAAGIWRASAVGLQAVRARCSAYTSGGVDVIIRAVNASPTLIALT